MTLRVLGLVALAGACAAQGWQFDLFPGPRECMAVDVVDTNVVFFEGYRPESSQLCVYRTKDGGLTWELFPWSDWGIYDLSATDSLHVWAVNIHRVYHSADGGRTWEVQFDASTDTTITTFLDYVEMFDPLNGVVVGDAPANGPLPVLTTNDGGKTWVQRNQSFFVGHHLSDLWRGVDFVSPMVGYGRFALYNIPLVNFSLHKTTDGGVTWQPLPLTAGQVNLVRFYDENLGLAAFRGIDSLYLTTDGGASFRAYYPALGSGWFADIEFFPGDPSKVLAALSRWGCLAFSSDTGKTWEVVPTPNICFPQDIEMADQWHGWVVGERGVLRVTRLETGIEPPHSRSVPLTFRLLPNHPNPFRTVTAIRFDLSAPERISVEVFNLQGQKVATLAEAQQFEAGTHELLFRAQDLPTAVYLCRLKAGSAQVTSKLALVR